jgi:L,D-transpeptidase ErfK/SrfK
MNVMPSSGNRLSWPRWIPVVVAVVYLAGCSALPSWPPHFAKPSHVPVPSDRFLLPPEGTDVVGTVQIATAGEEDTLLDIARRYDLGYEEIIAANPGIDPWLPRAGTPVLLPTQFLLPDAPRKGLVLNLAAMRLFFYPEPVPGSPAMVITHPIGIGREGWETPKGESRVIQKMVEPAWTVPVSIRREHARKGDPLPPVVPPGPDNPLGDFALRLSLASYLIHGTNKPYGVGMRVSHGCVRLYPEDISRLFPEVPLGTPVRIVNQPYLAGWRDGLLYLEAHPPLVEDARRWKGSLAPMEAAVTRKAPGSPGAVDWRRARSAALQARGIPVPISAGSPELDEMLAQAPLVPSTPPWVRAREGG